MRSVRPSPFFVVLVGGFSGAMLSAALILMGERCLDTPLRSAAHYVAAVVLGLGLNRLSQHRPGAPVLATVVLATLLTFTLRRWLGLWVNLEALDWGSGPAGEVTAVVLPLEGMIFGIVAAGDARPRDLA